MGVQRIGAERDVDRRLAWLLTGAPRHADEPAATRPDQDPSPAEQGGTLGVAPAAADPPPARGTADGVPGEARAGAEESSAQARSAAMVGSGGDEDADEDAFDEASRRHGPGWLGARRFERPHVAVVAVIVLVGLALAGWAVLRARPVAIASPAAGAAVTAVTSPTAAPTMPPAAASATAPAPTPPAAEPSGPSSGGPVAVIEVHVLGAVRHPGVVELPAGARVQDALVRAGGVTKSAELGALNLAQPLGDGQQIVVARSRGHTRVRDPVAPMAVPGTAPAAGLGGAGGGSTPGRTRVNINIATAAELDQLPGVGPVTAQKILDWRGQNGRFSSVDELQEVDGIGPKTFADLQPWVTV